MIWRETAALVPAWLLGVLLVVALWPRSRSCRPDAALLLSFGLLVGLGVTSSVFFFASLLTDRAAWVAGLFEAATVAVLLVRVRDRFVFQRSAEKSKVQWHVLLLGSLFAQATIVALLVCGRAFLTEPFGGWDGWAIWNMHARFMHRAGSDWPELLSAASLNWTHPDYPRLVPGAVARIWAWSGGESARAAGMISMAFAVGSVGLLVAIVARLRGVGAGCLVGLILLATPFYVAFSSNQHADIPLGSLMLATVVAGILAHRESSARLWLLAGICAGLGAWTKNEGLLFALCVGAVWGVAHLGRAKPSMLKPLLAGFCAALVPVIVFKTALAPSNDLLSAPWAPRLGQLIDADRHALILSTWWRDLRGFGEWHVAPFLAMAFPFVAWRNRRQLAGAEYSVFALLGLMMLGYYAVYLLSHHDVRWHLDTSLVRLLIQLWPLALLGWGLMLPWPELPAVSIPRIRWVAIVVVNLAVAAGLLSVMSRQLAANELAVQRVANTELRVALGEGWYGRERQGGNMWAWSSGRAALQLHAAGAPSRALTLRFTVRTLGARKMELRQGGTILWQASLEDRFAPIVVPDLNIKSGMTSLEFVTDVPGRPEAPQAGARLLAFAVYNLAIE